METMVLCQHMFTTLKLPGYKVAFFIKCNQYFRSLTERTCQNYSTAPNNPPKQMNASRKCMWFGRRAHSNLLVFIERVTLNRLMFCQEINCIHLQISMRAIFNVSWVQWKAHVVSLVMTLLYPHYLVLGCSWNEFKHDLHNQKKLFFYWTICFNKSYTLWHRYIPFDESCF